ncbi:MAG: SPOR domain-containing protein [Actinobacteria bacterium]|nr:SPOR domain-containing protein [Actinomycetota bacterium]
MTRLLIGGAMAAVMSIATLAGPAQAASSGWESILGGHITSRATADKIAAQARKAHFKTYVQKIASTNYEVEIFNGGGSKSQAVAACAKAKKAGLPHCGVEQEFHGNGWSKGGS